MAATERQWSIREDGCLIINKNLQGVTYHSSLNAIILSSKDQTITVLDATSGIVLQKSDLSGKKCETLRCIYLPEKDRCIFSDTHSVSVRRDLRGILLLDTALQIPVKRSDEIIRLEIPLAEAVQLFDALVNVELAGIEHVEDVVKELDRSIELARKATEGSHKTAKWATVCIQLQHGALKSVCSALVAEIKRTSQQGQGLPVAAAISDRLSHLLPTSNDNGAGPVDRSLMYSEAARRHTFSKWPHMGYKWALPEPMAQAGFYHQPNSPGDDRAMCFTCNVCLVCWEPTDEPWSEHERHSPQCPYIKGDFTQNVPLAVTYATQPAQLHGEGQKIACISSTCNEDFIATSTRDGSIVVWNISHMLQKECAFNLDLSDATVALKTGLQIERVGWTADVDTRGQGSKVESEVTEAQEKSLEFTEKEEECIQEINLHKNADDNIEGKNRPSDDLIVSSLCIIDWSSCKNSEHLASLACPQVKGACAAETVEPSLVCGASLLRTKAMYRNDSECWPSSQQGSSLDGHQEVVQLMNQVNQGIWNGDLHIIPEPASGSVGEDFVWPESVFVPHLLVVSFRAESSNGVHAHAKSKEPGSEGNSGSGGIVGDTGSGSKPTSTVGEGSKVVPVSTLVPVKESPWSILLENDPWLDPDVQIVGFTPGHSQPSQLKDGPLSGISKPVPILQNGPSDLSGPFHTFSAFGSEGSSPLSPGMHMHPDILSEVWHKESESEEKSGDALRCPGSVLQCVPLPEEFCSEMLEIKTIQPTVDRHYVIVVVAPKSEYICCNESPCVDLGCSSEDSGQVQGTGTDTASLFHRQDSSKASAPINISGGSQAASEVSASSQRNTTRNLVLGGVMVYKVKTVNGYTVLEDNPCMVHKIWQPEKVVREIFVLPPEVAEQIDEEETIAQLGMASGLTDHRDFQGGSTNGLGAIGQVAIITQEGALKILNLADARIIADLSPDDGEKFISAAYCTGIEHLCVCTTSGKLKFYQVSQQQTAKSGEMHMQEDKTPRVLPSAMDGVDGKKVAVEEDGFDASPGKPSQGSCCLADGPLVPENLLALHSLTQFENLMPRFTATVPPCWSEIQQEQQQRRHPQHLQQQGEATQHTRSWKLTQNGTTWDEHLFEIVLPRPCCIGHVDVKFTLHPMCTTAPNIEVTLLKQNIGNVGRQVHLSSHPKSRDRHPRSSGSSSTEKDNVNYVLDPAFLEKNNAEILCGPIKLSSCLDLSGGGGLASLSSPSLLNCKPRSLLLHIKGFKNETSDNSDASDKASSSSSEEKADKAPEVKKKGISYMEYKGIKCLFENVPSSGSGASAVERLSASAPKQKLTDVKGCDWLAEISLTVRKFKRTSVLRERQQRNAMLESPSFHEKLLRAVTCPPAELQGMNAEHYQNLALDILLWIGSLQMNDPLHQSGSKCLVVTLEPFLQDLVKACFVNATRTTSHKCARLLAQSIEFAKLSEDQDLAPSFSLYLLQAIVSCLSLLVFCSSAGAMRWFFAILNHVKCMDTSLVARSVMDLLNSVAAQYQQNMSPLHALLKTRYGLYGHPFDVEMFDVELPHNLRQGPIPPSSYAAAAAKGACTFHGPSAATSGAPAMSSASTSGSGGQNKEEPDLYEMLSMPHEKAGRSQAEYMRHHVLGLLEVEPLPFTCHATSDGTRVERMDAASAATTATATGPNITAPSVPLSMGPVNLDEPPPSGGLLVGGPFVSGAVGTSTGSMSSLAVADSLKKALQTYAAINAKQMHPSKLHQLLSWSGGAPKTTPNFLTPSVTPPSEAWQPPVLPSFLKDVDKHLSSPPPPPPPPPLPQQPEKSLQTPTGGDGQPDILKLQATFSGLSQTPHQQQQQAAQKPSPYPQTHTLLQSPPDQVLVIERMHSGARRFVTLDFGKVVVLTDVVIPACGDLASLSIDVWVQGEEVDGQRLVVASDIGTRTLVMNNIMPAPICRYLKITTVGRYGAGTTRSRIPLGAFYGHSYILPWEWREYVDSHSFSPVASINSAPSPLSSPPHSSRGSGVASPVKQLEAASQSSLMQHLGVFLSLQEDLHCLYSLACSRLSGLLSSVSDTQFVSSHVKYYLKRGQQPLEEDAAILKSYNECLQLQLQLNLAQRAITRLQRALGVKVGGYDETTSVTTQLQQTSTDKLRVMLEGLLDTLLGLTVPCPAVPQPPAALYMALPPSTAEALFRNICLLGSRHTQVKTGLLLSRVCGSQPWWGTFLGNILQEFFHSEYSQVFPQDRVFVLVSALGQKALAGPSAVHIMDSLLAMLTSVLQPLVASRDTSSRAGSLDLGLVSWILLFLCRNFEAALSPAITDESEKGGKRGKEGTGGRWSFIQGSWKSLCPSSGKSKSRRLYSRSMQKRILHHKQKLEDIEAAKALMDVAKDKTKASSKENKVFLKEQEALIKKELAQFRSKHFKDMIYMRRNDLEILRRLPKEDGANGGVPKELEDSSDSLLVLPRDRCLMVVRGLMALLLSMDFSCHVDLFLVACKVLARICVVTRPALQLGEVMSQDQLEWLVLLAVHHDATYGPTLWGGPWASHAITCLLQDLLEGEKMYPRHLASSEEDLLRSEAGDDEEQLTPSATSLNLDEVTDDDMDNLTDGAVESGIDPSLDKDTTLMMDLLMEEAELEGDSLDALFMVEPPQTSSKMFPGLHPAFSPFSPKSFSFSKKSKPFPVSQQNGQMEFGDGQMESSMTAPMSDDAGQSLEKKTGRLRLLKTRLNNLISTKSGTNSHGLSVAQDARLEFGLQWLPELRLRVMLSVHMESILGAFTFPIPPPPQLPQILGEPPSAAGFASTDDELSQATLPGYNILTSAAMLSQCFDHLFAQLLHGRVSLDTVLQLWLTLNQNSSSPVSQDDHTSMTFNSTCIPSVPLGPQAVRHLMEAVVAAPVVSVRSWVFVLHTMCLLINQRADAVSVLEEGAAGGMVGQDLPLLDGGLNSTMASVVLTDPNLVPLIIKFLSGTSVSTSASSGLQFYQAGPTATKAFDDFLRRLLCKSVNLSGQNLKELLLKIVFQLTTERGAVATCTGPLDAQCKFVETVASLTFDAVDLSNAISVVAAISALVHQHILCQDPVLCSSSHDSSISARSCFSGLFASLLRGGESRGAGGEPNRDQLMCSLLRLINKLVQVVLPGSQPRGASGTLSSGGMENVGLAEAMSDAAKLNRAFSSPMSTSAVPLASSTMSDDEKRQQTSSSGGVRDGGVGPDTGSSERRQMTERYVADLILANRLVMQNLVQALSYCSSNKMALILGSAPAAPSSGMGATSDSFNMGDPLSVGDGIYQILCTLLCRATNSHSMINSLFHYLSANYTQMNPSSLCRLSEPLLKFLLRVLDSAAAVRHFVHLGGIQVLCNSLVRSSQQFVSVGPGIISTIMQNMSSLGATLADEKAKAADSENVEGLFNFAPLGSIVATSPTASPPDALIQTSAPHRRARTAAWSYHFYPDEPWVELVVTLPFAVLLRQVDIRPHSGALTTCPSFVSLEISHDGWTVVPTSPPLVTCSLAIIKLQLLRPEVVSSVTLRLHRPRDSMTIGLQQVCLRGQRAFGEVGEGPSALLPSEDTMSTCSMGWLRLLYHCLMSHPEVAAEVARAATPTCNLLNTCTSLLISPTAALYAAKIESVLLQLGLSSMEIGLALIDNILRNQAQCTGRGGGHIYLGRVSGVSSPYTMEILYQLGITQDLGTKNRVQALLQWLADSAQAFICRQMKDERMADSNSPIPSPAPEHVHCVAAVLWYSHDLPVEYNLQELVTENFVQFLYTWSSMLPVDSVLKKSINNVLCASCYIHPPYFRLLLRLTGFIIPEGVSTAVTDDSKDSATRQHQHQQQGIGGGSMTDDSKEASLQPQNLQPSDCGLDAGTMTDDSKEATLLSHTQQGLRNTVLDCGHLATIAVVSHSPAAVSQLLHSGLPAVLTQGLAEFCSHQIALIAEQNLASDARRQRQETTDNGPRKVDRSSSEQGCGSLTADLVAAVLSFFAELCWEPSIKDWLGTSEGNVFWPALLTLLCNTSAQRPPVACIATSDRQKVMNAEERALVETTAIQFFTGVIACHSVNQLFFAKVLCDVIRQQGASRSGTLLGTVPLSGFTRRMLLQVLLEDEKILVALRMSSELYCHLNTTSPGNKGSSWRMHHPSFGAGRGCCSLIANINNPCSDVMGQFGDPTTAAMVASSLLEGRDDSKQAEVLAKETTELGIEVMEYINAAGVLAKVKREKSPSPSKTGLPPRPPTRRGHVYEANSSSLKFPHCTLHLQHSLMKGKALPSDLTFSQLTQILLQRGLAPGTTTLSFDITVNTRTIVPPSSLQAALAAAEMGAFGSLLEWGDKAEDIPDEFLLASPAFPSALQVFASVGGLALLAEHLPLLYPHIARQGMAADVGGTENNNLPDLGQEWVTVESSDELFDPYMEPVSPAPASSQAARHVAGAMPTIPPHSLIAFGLFLRLPGYAEVLLKERKKAQCLLRLVLGVTDDGDGGHILTSPIASSLPTLPFTVLKSLLDASPLTTDDGVLLRRMVLDIGVLHLVLACLSVLSHHMPRIPVSGFQQETQVILAAMQAAATQNGLSQSEEKTQHYWAKGTGFGTGSTTSSWDAEQALLRQRSEEEHVAGLLQVLGSYINPGGVIPKDFCDQETPADKITVSASNSDYAAPSREWPLPEVLFELLSHSCLVPAISSYLRNDSVLDMARHVPLYRALLHLLRGMAVCPSLVPLLLPMPLPQSQFPAEDGCVPLDSTPVSIEKLLAKMKGCVDTYASRLKSNKGKGILCSKGEEEESEGLALLIPDIQETARIVNLATQRLKEAGEQKEGSSHGIKQTGPSAATTEERYLSIMGPMQFDTYELVTEEGRGLKFNIPHHFESNVKASGAFNNPARTRRLAQEAVTLSTSLPLSYNSSVFVRCDEERLDIMKVLITGPSDTPYANGAFEFDVYFPQDYPNSPPYINLETTGNHTVRFNPNLYNDGKVCLSILNTWHGRPEEKWNAQTSSFLQVLVSIQSLILVSEPYFNEPGYERSRGTQSGTASSHEYDANIRQATVKWAMLEQIRNPSACFKEVIHYHFWLKRHEILRQCEDWIAEMEQHSSDKRTGRSIAHSTLALKRHYNQLREELSKLKPPPELEADCDGIDPNGKHYSTDAPQVSAANSIPLAVPKPTSAPTTSNLAVNSTGLGPYIGPNGLFVSDPFEQEVPDV